MSKISVLSIDGKVASEIEAPSQLSYPYKPWLINRAVLAENSMRLQPQGHYLLAGMQTTAVYVGKMHAWRTGRHVGRAIRPREKLAEGALGKVRRIPSAVTGKRASPHLIEKVLVEKINRTEYVNALYSAIAKTIKRGEKPLVFVNDIEGLKRSKDVDALLRTINIDTSSKSKIIKKGIRRSSRQRKYTHVATIVVNEDRGIIRAARNLPGVNVCTLDRLTVGKLMPGGTERGVSIWSESAIKQIGDMRSKIRMV